MTKQTGTREDRFWSRVARGAPDECWEWLGPLIWSGYGIVWDEREGKGRSAHIVAYEFVNGPVPPGLELDHVCHNRDPKCQAKNKCRHRRCVNPAHLEAVTSSVNKLRSKGWTQDEHGVWTCKRGHVGQMTSFNSKRDGVVNVCGTCRAQANGRYRRRQAK